MLEIVFCGTGWLPVVEMIRERLPEGAVVRMRDHERPIEEDLRQAHIILPSNAHLGAAAIRAPLDLRLIQQPAVGVDGIDLGAARERGVPVCNVPAANGEAVAEAALFLMLALARRLTEARRAFAQRQLGVPVGVELRDKVLGLVGRGRSGSRLAAIGEALGMRVLAVDSKSSRADLEAVLAEADFVSLHCPLTPATRGLLDRAAFARMKEGAFLVNCARGPIVERGALEEALASGRLGGVGLDTYWAEPWDPADPLYAREDPPVVTLPHIGGSTREAFGRIADTVVENVARVMRGEEPLHRVV